MRPVTLSLSTAGLSLPCPLDFHITQFQVMLAYEQNGAVAQATVQWSADDPFGTFDASGNSIPYPVDYNTNANWYDITAMSAMVGSTRYSLGGIGTDNNYPARAVRLKNNTWTSGTNKLVITQVGGGS